MKPPEPLENTPIFHGKALWTVLERYRICMASQTFVRENLRAKHRARQENMAALVGRWIDGHYRKAGYSKKFRAEHEADILLHQTAKKAFDELGMKKLPTVKSLQTEYAELMAQKKAAYSSYRKARDEMKELLTVKANVDRIMGYEEEKQTEKDRTKER